MTAIGSALPLAKEKRIAPLPRIGGGVLFMPSDLQV